MMQRKRIKATLKYFVFILTLVFILGDTTEISVQSKTMESEKGNNIFFYVLNDEGKSILLKVVTLEELTEISHGQLSDIMTGTDTGVNYNISTTDNYPTTQYCEARGITVSELVDYIKSVTSVKDINNVTFSGNDIIRLMATDSFGNYSRAWSYNELYGVNRYYFEGLYDKNMGWKPGWEIAGEDNSKFGISLDTYYSEFKDKDQYYDDKRDVFETGVRTVPVLATQSFSGRTTSDTLVSSTEIGISNCIAENGGIVAGCLSDELKDSWSLRLSLPMTETDLMGARRTAYDNFKWIYNFRLDMEESPAIESKGTVAEPQVSITPSSDGKSLSVTISCETTDATVYYSFDGSPQIPYTGTFSMDVSGRDLATNPVTIYMTAVKEGWDDAGIITLKYPGLSPAFQTLYSGMVGENLSFSASSDVIKEQWDAWTGVLDTVSMKTPTENYYMTLGKDKYFVDNSTKTITFDKSLFTYPGSYSFIFHASKYSNKKISLIMKKAAPVVNADISYILGGDISFTFNESDYQKGMSVYLTLPDGSTSMISSTYLNRTVPGKLIIKASYFTSPSCMIKQPDTYVLELRNSAYSPSEQAVKIKIETGSSFIDVPTDAWYFNAVKYVNDVGLFSGTGSGLFSPDDSMTRGMFVTALSRYSSIDVDNNEEGYFDDIKSGEWYTGAINWAAKNKIIMGLGNNKFDPDRPLTREEMVVILYRYAGYSKLNVTSSEKIMTFVDADLVSSWAYDGMQWAVDTGLITGVSDTGLNSKDSTTRAQAAQVLMRYFKEIY